MRINTGIEDQIYQDLLQRHSVAPHRRQCRRDHNEQAKGLAQQSLSAGLRASRDNTGVNA
jgi:hypothetical protein